jgi:hypothetical protein
MTDLTVSVSGAPSPTRTAVATIVASTLTKKGFTNVELLDNIGEPITVGDSATILDLAIKANPHAFASNICVMETDVDEFSVVDDSEEEPIQTSDPALTAMAENVI